MLTIPLSTLGWIIVKAREFDGKDVDTDDPGDDSDNPLGVLDGKFQNKPAGRGEPNQDNFFKLEMVEKLCQIVGIRVPGRGIVRSTHTPRIIENQAIAG